MRGIAAMLVMLSHARPMFFENYDRIAGASGYLVAGSAHNRSHPEDDRGVTI
ncbi:hypothetical protein [Celeribacter sp. HF31]|uniref:hypothetical protein n=1 Tax=Celeribacter sp. HF31 TaxID=2721558 RepID=UPI001431B0FB|nr:hypothetical protein [Celeribacter sp. HF31]